MVFSGLERRPKGIYGVGFVSGQEDGLLGSNRQGHPGGVVGSWGKIKYDIYQQGDS
jgi:hypothetical protein